MCILVCINLAGDCLAVQPRSRLPLQSKSITIGQPAPVGKELQGYDKDGQPIYWDPRPRVVALGGGRYAFKWFGRSGRELSLVYERPDAVDVVVEAFVDTGERGDVSYRYSVHALKTSPLPVTGFVVQTFSQKTTPKTNSARFAGKMAAFTKEFAQGEWIAFGPLGGRTAVTPGEHADFAFSSPDLPGVVACRAHGGSLIIAGVGEEPPTVLENLYLGHDAWPQGYTIGPDERLAKMSLKERQNYLIERLPKMLELGWIENQAVMQWYKQSLEAGKTSEVRTRAKADLDRNLITSEVVALITYLLR
jgi:hypothetical protein